MQTKIVSGGLHRALMAGATLVLLAGVTRAQDATSSSVANQNPEGQAQGNGALEEIIVTAQKRSEDIQNVPIPVTVLAPATLSANEQVRLRDYYSSVPGLEVAPDIENNQMLSIRGITTGGFSNPTVGVVIDDVPFGASQATAGGNSVPDIDPGDLQRIEVLRGPQGTLYGDNSMGGLIKYVTKDPSTNGFSGRVQFGTNGVQNGAEPGYDARASANIPLTDALAVRVSGFRRQDPGYIDNPVLGRSGVNQVEAYGGRFAAIWQPIDDLTLRFSALYQDTSSNGLTEVVRKPGLGDLQQNFVAGTHGFDKSVQAYSASVNYQVGGVSLTSLTGYNINWGYGDFDFTTILGSYTDQGIPGTSFTGFGVKDTPFSLFLNIAKFSQELRAETTIADSFDLLVGGFFTNEHTQQINHLDATNPQSGAIIGQDWYANAELNFQEYAVFADLTYHFDDRFQIQLGGRESFTRESSPAIIGEGPFNVLFLGQNVPVAMTAPQSAHSNTFTYLLTPQYKVSDNLMAYIRLASGFRPGGPNAVSTFQGAPPQFAPDKTQDYEIGAKGNLFNHLLTFDASLYYIDWHNLQITLFTPQKTSYGANGSGAKSEGAELSVTATPRDGLTISAWGSYDDAVLTQAFPANSTAFGANGDRLPNTPRWSANLSVEQRFNLWGGATGFVGGSVSYIGGRLSIFQTTPLRQVFPAYTKGDLRAGFDYDTWAVNVYVNNVGDARGLINGGIGFNQPDAFIIIPPRTIGATITKAF